jgi:hypothetical protein
MFDTELKALSKKKFELTQTLEVRAWTLPAGEAQVYRDVITELEKSDLELVRAVKGGRFTRDLKDGVSFGFWDLVRWLIVGALVAYFIWRFGGPA